MTSGRAFNIQIISSLFDINHEKIEAFISVVNLTNPEKRVKIMQNIKDEITLQKLFQQLKIDTKEFQVILSIVDDTF